MFSAVDPCARCNCPMERKTCQGSPWQLGVCPSAKGHWDFVSAREMRGYEQDSFNRQAHNASRNCGRNKGW